MTAEATPGVFSGRCFDIPSPDPVFASRRRMILSVSVQAVLTIFAASIVFSRTQGPEAAWILLWWLLDFTSGGNSSIGRISHAVRTPLLSAVAVTGILSFLVTFTALDESVTGQWSASEDRSLFLLVLWSTAVVTAVMRALIIFLMPKRTLRIVTGSPAHSARVGSEIVFSRKVAADPDAFVAAVLGEVNRGDVELVELTFPIDAELLRSLSWHLRKRDIELYVPLFELGVDPTRVHALSAANSSGLLIAPSRPDILVRVSKRFFDMLTAGLLVLVFSPLLVAVAIAIRISMPGPVFYFQERVGLDGKPFRIVKFRSMVVDADSQLGELLRAQGTSTQPLFKVGADPRITRLGHFLRRSSIDELPQLFNVVGGSMSLVGPRPQREGEVALYTGSDHHRLGVRPGMTGLWQVSGRSDLGWAQAREFDLYYAHNWNLKNDLSILVRTFGAVVRAAGAQ